MRFTSYILWDRVTEIVFENILRLVVKDIFKSFQCLRPNYMILVFIVILLRPRYKTAVCFLSNLRGLEL